MALEDLGEAFAEYLAGHQTVREMRLFIQRATAILETEGRIGRGSLQKVLAPNGEDC